MTKRKGAKTQTKACGFISTNMFFFKLFAFPSNPLTFGVPDKAYYRNTLCILLLISTFLLL